MSDYTPYYAVLSLLLAAGGAWDAWLRHQRLRPCVRVGLILGAVVLAAWAVVSVSSHTHHAEIRFDRLAAPRLAQLRDQVVGHPGRFEIIQGDGVSFEGVDRRVASDLAKGKFHRIECDRADLISANHLLFFDSREEAIAAGKEPCRTCRP